MRILYFYFMKDAPDRARAAAPRHAAYWRGLALREYLGGPFADRSGGLIIFNADSGEQAEQLSSLIIRLNCGNTLKSPGEPAPFGCRSHQAFPQVIRSTRSRS